MLRILWYYNILNGSIFLADVSHSVRGDYSVEEYRENIDFAQEENSWVIPVRDIDDFQEENILLVVDAGAGHYEGTDHARVYRTLVIGTGERTSDSIYC